MPRRLARALMPREHDHAALERASAAAIGREVSLDQRRGVWLGARHMRVIGGSDGSNSATAKKRGEGLPANFHLAPMPVPLFEGLGLPSCRWRPSRQQL